VSNLGNKKVMAANIRRYMLVNDVSPTDICKDLDFKMPTFSDWIHARTYPRIDKIEKMANYFGIQKSDLIEEKTATQNGSGFSPSQKALLDVIDGLSEDQARKLLGIIAEAKKLL